MVPSSMVPGGTWFRGAFKGFVEVGFVEVGFVEVRQANRMAEVYDVLVIGCGPAGAAAAIYALRQGLRTLVVSPNVGGQVLETNLIENYPAFPRIASHALAKNFEEHLKSLNAEVALERVKRVEKAGAAFKVLGEKNVYEARTVVVATGAEHRKLNVPGEERLARRGVTYCVICDGPLFKGKDVAVIGGGNSAMTAALLLSKVGASKIYLIDNSPEVHGEAPLVEQVKRDSKIAVLNNALVLEVLGENSVDGIKFKAAGVEKTLPVQGVFVEIGLRPASEAIDFVEKNERGEIIVDAACRTSVPGIFAAGDVTNVPEKQIVVAAGEGAKAALSVAQYLGKLKKY